MKISEFEKVIGYEFKNKGFLITALTHSSYANERGQGECNERLETVNANGGVLKSRIRLL